MTSLARRVGLFVAVAVGLYLTIAVGAGVAVVVLDTGLQTGFHASPSLHRKFVDGAALGLIVAWPGVLAVSGIVTVAHRIRA